MMIFKGEQYILGCFILFIRITFQDQKSLNPADVSKVKRTSFSSHRSQIEEANVPNPDFRVPLSEDDLTAYKTEIYDPDITPYSTSLCNNGLCCEFTIESQTLNIKPSDKDQIFVKYRLVVFKGVPSYAVARTGIEKRSDLKSNQAISKTITENNHGIYYTSNIDETLKKICLSSQEGTYNLKLYAIRRDISENNTEATTSSTDAATTGSTDATTTGSTDATTTGSTDAATTGSTDATTGSTDATTTGSTDAATSFLTHDIFITMLSLLFVRLIVF